MSKRFLALDGIRGIAVFMVFFSHTSGREQALHEYFNLQGLGHIGVYLFFVLSGFLLSMGLFKKGITKTSLQQFYVKRTMRIIPLYYLVCISVFAYQHFTGNFNTNYLFLEGGWTGLWKHLLFLQADGVFWSILIEMHFYLAVPWIIYSLIRFRTKAIYFWLGVSLINSLLYLSYNLGKYDFTNEVITYLSFHHKGSTFVDVFIFGILGAYLLHFNKPFLQKHLRFLHRLANISFFGLMLLTLVLVTKHFFIFEQPLYPFRFISLLYGGVFGLTVLSIYLNNPLNKYLHFYWLRFIGIIGYSFYLLHFAILQIVNHLAIPDTLKFFISLLLVCIVSKISFELVEQPSIKLAKWINSKFITT